MRTVKVISHSAKGNVTVSSGSHAVGRVMKDTLLWLRPVAITDWPMGQEIEVTDEEFEAMNEMD